MFIQIICGLKFLHWKEYILLCYKAMDDNVGFQVISNNLMWTLFSYNPNYE